MLDDVEGKDARPSGVGHAARESTQRRKFEELAIPTNGLISL